MDLLFSSMYPTLIAVDSFLSGNPVLDLREEFFVVHRRSVLVDDPNFWTQCFQFRGPFGTYRDVRSWSFSSSFSFSHPTLFFRNHVLIPMFLPSHPALLTCSCTLFSGGFFSAIPHCFSHVAEIILATGKAKYLLRELHDREGIHVDEITLSHDCSFSDDQVNILLSRVRFDALILDGLRRFANHLIPNEDDENILNRVVHDLSVSSPIHHQNSSISSSLRQAKGNSFMMGSPSRTTRLTDAGLSPVVPLFQKSPSLRSPPRTRFVANVPRFANLLKIDFEQVENSLFGPHSADELDVEHFFARPESSLSWRHDLSQNSESFGFDRNFLRFSDDVMCSETLSQVVLRSLDEVLPQLDSSLRRTLVERLGSDEFSALSSEPLQAILFRSLMQSVLEICGSSSFYLNRVLLLTCRVQEELCVLRQIFFMERGDVIQEFCSVLFSRLDEDIHFADSLELNAVLQHLLVIDPQLKPFSSQVSYLSLYMFIYFAMLRLCSILLSRCFSFLTA